jgi:hypothetical protein
LVHHVAERVKIQATELEDSTFQLLQKQVQYDLEAFKCYLAKVKNVPVGVVSMGEGTMLGDSSPLYSAMRNYNKVGGWLVLENAHLVPAIELEKSLALASDDDFQIERHEFEKSPMLSTYKKSSATSANNYRMWDQCQTQLFKRNTRHSTNQSQKI